MDLQSGRAGLPSLPKRLLWFVGLWLGGVAAIGILGLAIKLALRG
jgi:hypothetical protein